MSWYRWLSCAVLLGVVDAAWLFLLFGLLGFVAGVGQSPLSWWASTSVMLVALVARAVRELMPSHWALRALWLPSIVALVGWLGVGSAMGPDRIATGFDWPQAVFFTRADGADIAVVALAGLLIALLWRHGSRLAVSVVGTPAFARSFRTGLVVFTAVLTFEAAGQLDLGTAVAMGPFFIGGLFGMALARAPTHGVSVPMWLGLVLSTVGAVLTAGMMAAVVLVAVVRGGIGAVSTLWVDVVHTIDESVSAALVELLGERQVSDFDLQSATSEPAQELVLLVLLIGALVFAALFRKLLNAPPRVELPGIVLDLGRAELESIEEPQTGVAEQWFERLRPRWPWHRARSAAMCKARGDPERARVLALYWQLLDRAQRQGAVMNPAQTPRERVALLCKQFPHLPVVRVTHAFEAACYGRQRWSREEVDRLCEACERTRG